VRQPHATFQCMINWRAIHAHCPSASVVSRTKHCHGNFIHIIMRVRSLFVVALLASSVSAQQPIFQFHGSSAGNLMGRSIAAAGDVNGDDLIDAIVGSPLDNGSGSANVLSGADGSVLYTLLGDSPGDEFGISVDGAGDVNGDGFADLIVGAPGDDNTANDAGSVRVISGADGSTLYTFDGDSANDNMGSGVAGAGDVNGDGFDDLIAGAPGDDNNGGNSGMARVYSGRDGSILHSFNGDSAGDRLGSSVDGAGDINGDGRADLIVGAPNDDNTGLNAGMARVLSGANGAILYSFDGDKAGDEFGRVVIGTGDVDNDGTGDIAVGAPLADTQAMDSGMVKVFSGLTGAVLHTVEGQNTGDACGTSVAAGDADGDRLMDLLIGIPGDDTAALNAGAAIMVVGASGCDLYSLQGASQDDGFGTAVGIGDFDLDGIGDAIVGVPGDDFTGADAGAALAFRSAPIGLAESTTLSPAQTGAYFGFDANPVGDLNGDSIPDYVVGSPFDLARAGAARVYSGADNSIIYTFIGPTPVDTSFGQRANSVGDIDSDGVNDIGVGAYHFDGVNMDEGMVELYSGKTGAFIQRLNGPGFRSHFGGSLAGIGDIDNDNVDDFIVGMGLDNGEIGAVWAFSGKTRTHILSMTFTGTQVGEWFGWSVDGVGDVNGDGYGDFIIGAPSGQVKPTPGNGYAIVYSGKDGSVIYNLQGVGVQDLFGWVVSGAGDINADGTPDFIVGAYRHNSGEIDDAGMARVFSGADGSVLYTIEGTGLRENLGRNVGGAGDVNGDGFDDFLVGSPGGSPTTGKLFTGMAQLFSGCDGRLLLRVSGDNLFDEMGSTCTGIGDVNGDGYSDIVVGAQSADVNAMDDGLVRVITTQPKSDVGVSWTFGASCPSSSGFLPRIGATGNPVLDGSYTTTLRAAPPVTPALWILGGLRTPQPLTPIGATGCTLYTPLTLVLPLATDLAGTANYTVAVPFNLFFIGQTVYSQWALLDIGANTLGVTTTSGAAFKLGR